MLRYGWLKRYRDCTDYLFVISPIVRRLQRLKKTPVADWAAGVFLCYAFHNVEKKSRNPGHYIRRRRGKFFKFLVGAFLRLVIARNDPPAGGLHRTFMNLCVNGNLNAADRLPQNFFCIDLQA
jgi:hypothetical protein